MYRKLNLQQQKKTIEIKLYLYCTARDTKKKKNTLYNIFLYKPILDTLYTISITI